MIASHNTFSYLQPRHNIYEKTYNIDPHDEQNVTISIARQAVAGEDFTYPSITTPSTGLYQYIDNHIKNFDLSWQILD